MGTKFNTTHYASRRIKNHENKERNILTKEICNSFLIHKRMIYEETHFLHVNNMRVLFKLLLDLFLPGWDICAQI